MAPTTDVPDSARTAVRLGEGLAAALFTAWRAVVLLCCCAAVLLVLLCPRNPHHDPSQTSLLFHPPRRPLHPPPKLSGTNAPLQLLCRGRGPPADGLGAARRRPRPLLRQAYGRQQ